MDNDITFGSQRNTQFKMKKADIIPHSILTLSTGKAVIAHLWYRFKKLNRAQHDELCSCPDFIAKRLNFSLHLPALPVPSAIILAKPAGEQKQLPEKHNT